MSLREHLGRGAAGASRLIGYLTLGDPPDQGRFVELACALVQAGATTLELGIPLDAPREGEVLLASHARARAGGVDEAAALATLRAVCERLPAVPMIVVNQWPALGSAEALGAFVQRAADAGAAALLVVGLPFGMLRPYATFAEQAGLETVLSCFPDSPKMMRKTVYKRTSGCIYLARSRGESGGVGAQPVEQVVQTISAETDLPVIVGFGIDSPQAVARVCQAGAGAAGVGSARVGCVAGQDAQGRAPGDFVRWLVG